MRIGCFLIWLLFPFSFILAQSQNTSPPNIILLFSDDAGYADFGFQGSSQFSTPHLDRLARQSVRCTQAYVTAAVCGPSRAGLLTGKYQQRFGFEENNVPGYMSPSGPDGPEMGLPLNQTTIADHLKQQGYRTALFGKWHLGGADKFHPTQRGFDEFFGFRGGARKYFAYHNEGQDPMNRLERGFGRYEEHDGYLTDVLVAEANIFMEKNQDRPFFLFLSFNAVHTPMQATAEDLKSIEGLSGKRRTLAAMTIALDRACGNLLAKLEELGLDENTIVVFTNDNGGPSDANESVNDPLSGTKANHLEGGIRVPFLLRWPSKVRSGSIYPHPISTLDLLPTFVEAAGGDTKAIDGLDGYNLLPFFQGQEKERPHQTLFWKKESRAAIRDGDWKLIRFPDRPAELYNLENDIAEVNNLSSLYPEKVRVLFKKLFEWELQLERPLWQLKRKYESLAAERMDKFRKPKSPPTLSAATKRAMERDYHQGPDWFCEFRQFDLKGDLGYEAGVIRRDPSAIISVDSTYFVYYTKGIGKSFGFGTGDPTKKVFPWDQTDIWYATSNDGWNWREEGPAVERGSAGSFDDRAVFTPEVLAHKGKFYLVYQVVQAPYVVRVKNQVAMAIADSPHGPWKKLESPILSPAENGEWLGEEDDRFQVKQRGDFDSHKVHDPCLMYYRGKFYLYYKGEQMGEALTMGGRNVRWGVAIADQPEGPYVKSPFNPITNSGHEICVWPHQGGIAALITSDGPEKNTIQYAPDGINFEIKSMIGRWHPAPHAAGLVRALDSEKEPLEALRWGLCFEHKNGWNYLRRFEIVQPPSR